MVPRIVPTKEEPLPTTCTFCAAYSISVLNKSFGRSRQEMELSLPCSSGSGAGSGQPRLLQALGHRSVTSSCP